MPSKPAWYTKIDDAIRELQALPRPFVDRATIEFLLGVRRRRAQQIMAPCVTDHVGRSSLASRDRLIAHLSRLAQGQDGHYERQRQRKVAAAIEALRADRLRRPALLVEAPPEAALQRFDKLPSGVHLERGRITLEFRDPHEALEKLLALAMAIGNDFDCFERSTR